MANNYEIKAGDTLSGIASKYGISQKELMAANPGIKDVNSIKAGQSINIPMVSSSSIDAPEDSFKKTNETEVETDASKEPWQNLQKMVDDGSLTAEKTFFGLIKTGTYNYTSDGKLTYGQLKTQLGFEDGVIRDSNPGIVPSKDADNQVIPKGTVLKFDEADLPKKPLVDKNGNEVEGFEKSILSDTIYYEVKSGDTQEGIYDKFAENKKALKGYKTADALYGYPQETLQPGTQVPLYKKFLGIF